jgi:hypothetical protein
MTKLLKQAFDAASKLSTPEQDLLAARLMAEIAAENAFDATLAASGDKLAILAREALEEFRVGR